MSVDDRSRLELHRRLSEVIGTEGADTLMAHLPPVTWQDVATKQDLHALGSELRGEMAELRGELRGELAELRGEFRSGTAELRGEVRTELTGFRGELTGFRGELGGLRGELGGFRGELATMEARMHSQIDHAITKQTWRLATFVGAWGALLVTVVGLVR